MSRGECVFVSSESAGQGVRIVRAHRGLFAGYPVDTPVDRSHDVESRGVVKAFYSAVLIDRELPGTSGGSAAPWVSAASDSSVCSRARVAVYEAPGAAPRVVDIEPAPVDDYIEALSTTVYQLAKEQGGDVPYSVVREVAENLIHARFSDPVISVMDAGCTIRFADRGPGIVDKERAVLPGFTTATGDMRRHIRGVGSGLPLVRDFLGISGGNLRVEDNLGHGAVVTVTSGRPRPVTPSPTEDRPSRPAAVGQGVWTASHVTHPSLLDEGDTEPLATPILSTRQKQVLALVMESGAAGPSLVSRELGVGVSTAYRDLASLEDLGMIESDGGKRSLTTKGLAYLDTLTSAL